MGLCGARSATDQSKTVINVYDNSHADMSWPVWRASSQRPALHHGRDLECCRHLLGLGSRVHPVQRGSRQSFGTCDT